MDTQFHIIYKTSSDSGRYYIGRHSTYNLNDGYLGSGKWIKSIKNKNLLSREIISYHNTFEELIEAEEILLLEVIEDPNNMNYNNKSVGFGTGEFNPSYGGTNRSWNKGKKCPSISEGRKNGKIPNISSEKRSELAKIAWKNGVFDNRPSKLSDNHKEKISKSLMGKTQSDYQKQRMKEVHTGKVYSKETREKIRIASIERESKTVVCPHCNFIGNGPVMKRWHFSNCKLAVRVTNIL